jgi:hypothetical protein
VDQRAFSSAKSSAGGLFAEKALDGVIDRHSEAGCAFQRTRALRGPQITIPMGVISLFVAVLSCDEDLTRRLSAATEPAKRDTTIRLSRAEAEQVRDYLTTELAASGFDQDYSPTQRGKMLEGLIDRFFIRERSG